MDGRQTAQRVFKECNVEMTEKDQDALLHDGAAKGAA